MRCPRPERFAAAHRGELMPADLRALERHSAGCPSCAERADGVRAAADALADVAAAQAPELSWDRLFAETYWTVSRSLRDERPIERLVERPRRWPWLAAAGAGVAMAALGAWIVWAGDDDRAPQQVASPTADQVMPVVLTSSHELSGVVTLHSGEVALDGQPIAMTAEVGAGAVLSTAAGRAVVQFGDGTGFALAPRSQLELRAFDSTTVELHVTGRVDITVSARTRQQSFTVVAGDHSVVVRGTAFSVEHRGGDFGVQCAEGRVDVTDGLHRAVVDAGHRLRLPYRLTTGTEATPIEANELESLVEQLTLPLLPGFDSGDGSLSRSAIVHVEAAADQRVVVDGVDVGVGAVSLRVSLGRHHVALPGSADAELSRGRWIEAQGQVTVGTRVAEAPDPRAASADARQQAETTRKRQLRRAFANSRAMRRCVSHLEKQGAAAGSFAVFDTHVNRDGSRRYLNVKSSNLSPTAQDCLVRAAERVSLPTGPSARVRARWRYSAR